MPQNQTEPACDVTPRCAARGGDITAGAAEGGSALRLDKRTYLDQSRYVANLRDFGDGIAEVSWSFVGASQGNKKPRGQSDEREKNEDRACRRAKSRLRHLALASQADHLLTLTYRENVTDFKEASRNLAQFIRKVRKVYPNWGCLSIAERQGRGAWHWHLAVRGWQDVGFLRKTWWEVVGAGQGNIDVQGPKGNPKKSRLRVVAYMCKYMVKGFAALRELNAHRFRASLKIEVPCTAVFIPQEARTSIADFVIKKLHSTAGIVGFIWHSEGFLAGWACSW